VRRRWSETNGGFGTCVFGFGAVTKGRPVGAALATLDLLALPASFVSARPRPGGPARAASADRGPRPPATATEKHTN
jgi:hypothetical protein